MMLAQMQDEFAARHLAIEWGVRIEAMVPIDREPEESQIEFVRFANIEEAQDRNDRIEDDCHAPLSIGPLRVLTISTSASLRRVQ
jgi:hypothetical protein